MRNYIRVRVRSCERNGEGPRVDIMPCFALSARRCDLFVRDKVTLCLLLQASESDRPQFDESGLPLDNLTKTSPPVQYFAVLCEALGILDRLDDALDECRQRMRAGLWHCVQSALKEIEKTHGKGSSLYCLWYHLLPLQRQVTLERAENDLQRCSCYFDCSAQVSPCI